MNTDTTATVIIVPSSAAPDLDFANGQLYVLSAASTGGPALNVNATSFTATATASFNSGGPISATIVYNATIPGLGTFNVEAYLPAPNDLPEAYTFLLTNNSGTWASAAYVLVANSSGFDAGATLFDCSGYSSAFVGEGSPVPMPPSALLLGSGLLGLSAVGWRRRRS
ncbi:MAG: hypothetical protein P8017_13305 [Deltaproteobacteria bacterium]